MPPPAPRPTPRHVVFFDHDCLLCNGTVRFLMARDKTNVLRFAPLQGPTAAEMFERHQAAAQDPDALTSIVFAENLGDPTTDRVSLRSTAVARILRKLGGPWGVLGLALLAIPRPLRDWGYGLVARNRLRWFGKATPETCPLPTPDQASRLLP